MKMDTVDIIGVGVVGVSFLLIFLFVAIIASWSARKQKQEEKRTTSNRMALSAENEGTVIPLINTRIDSLKANRNFLTVLLGIESTVLALIIRYSIEKNVVTLWPTSSLILLSLLSLLVSLFALTDSIHFHSKYLEYRYYWLDNVHGAIYYGKDRIGMSEMTFVRALEADDVGYHYQKLSLAFFLYSISFLTISIPWNLLIEIALSLWSCFFFTLLAVRIYGVIHGKNFAEALRGFFGRESIFDKWKKGKNLMRYDDRKSEPS
jgi:hypothetical protein